MEGKEEVGEGAGAARQAVKKSNHEQSDLGQKFGQIRKTNPAFYSPENLY
jgi:hypothetical protein